VGIEVYEIIFWDGRGWEEWTIVVFGIETED